MKCAPGSATSGVVKLDASPATTFGMPLTSCQRTRSAFQNQ